MQKETNVIELPNSDSHNCFACARSNHAGLHMKFFSDYKTVFSWVTVPDHLGGWNRLVHGGITTTILDETMGWSGLYLLKMIALTKTMTVDFPQAVYVGDQLRVEGRVLSVHKNKEALIEGFLYNSKGKLCANSKGTFSLLSPKIARRLGVVTDRQIDDFFSPLIELASRNPHQ